MLFALSGEVTASSVQFLTWSPEMKNSRKFKAKAFLRKLQKQRVEVFDLAEFVTKADKDDVEAAFRLADEMLKEVSENCLLQDVPLVVACMQYRMLDKACRDFEKMIKNLTTTVKEVTRVTQSASAEPGSDQTNAGPAVGSSTDAGAAGERDASGSSAGELPGEVLAD
jgi:hypothetical protein